MCPVCVVYRSTCVCCGVDLHVYVVGGWVGCMDLCECAQCVWCIDLHVYVVGGCPVVGCMDVVGGWVGVWIYVSVPSVCGV